MIKAIETVYRGYRFRSRLEARWAVFFDALRLKWDYEPEGFVLPDGTRYLPDFRLTTKQRQTWVEVKPTTPTPAEVGKLRGLVSPLRSDDYALFLCGVPGDADMTVLTVYAEAFGLGARKAHLGDIRVGFLLLGASWGAPGANAQTLWERAVDAARGARFEHGERGA